MEAQPSRSKVRVWDRFVRFFHWTLAASFAASYWSAKAGKSELHAVLGYFVAGLLVARVFWGFYGSNFARFSDFVHSPAIVWSYLRAIAAGHPRRFLGHNPAGGYMAIALLSALGIVCVTGLSVFAVIDFDGPLTGLLIVSDRTAYVLEDVHALAVNVVLVMIAIHLIGVIAASFQHRENIVRAMITGFKESRE